MPKLRTTVWFLLLVTLLAVLVSLAVAQETPTAEEELIIEHDLLSETGLSRSPVETPIEISTTSRQVQAMPSVSLDLSPAGEEMLQGPGSSIDSAAVPLPDELQGSLLADGLGPTDAEITLFKELQAFDFAGYRVSLPQPDPSPSAAGETCNQLLKNPELDVVGGDYPNWDVLQGIVYWTDEDYVSPNHSLVLVDNDDGDGSPTIDSFAQSFSAPANLSEVTIRYATASVNSNAADRVIGNVYSLDAGGALDEFLLSWEVLESPGTWQFQKLTITDGDDLSLLAGKDLAIILFSSTNGSAPGEVVFFDDVTFTACVEDVPDSHIIVKKQTNPSGATQKFTFNPSWSGANFQLSHGQSKTSPALTPGTYNVKELDQSGWTLSSATCDDGSSPNNISLQAGETVTCTFRNTKDAFIKVKKETDPNGATQKFTFQASWTSNFQLSDGQSKTSGALAPGTYSVKELAQSGWGLDSVTCSDGSNPNSISLGAGETVTCTFNNEKETTSQSCSQLLVNTQLNIVEFGDGTGTAEPWSILAPIVYYTHDPDLAYDGYSLFLEDGDAGDPSAGLDMFAQGFQMPGNLTEISIEYMRATLDTNATDEVYGELWLLDDDWVLDFDDADFVMGWPVNESDGAWGMDAGTWDDQALLKKMEGRKMAILLYNFTDGGGSKKEVVLFDNVKLSACSKKEPTKGKVFMPTILQRYGKATGPICIPPSENPADQWNADRGLVETGATCSSTLTSLDRKDYYTYKPTKSGKHILQLTNLPDGSNWTASIWVIHPDPAFAPGGSADGYCFTEQSGNGNKQVECTLNEGVEYFLRINSGETPMAGGYQAKITAP